LQQVGGALGMAMLGTIVGMLALTSLSAFLLPRQVPTQAQVVAEPSMAAA
jgi:hypothetical protein